VAKKSIDKPEYSTVCALLRAIRLKARLSQATLGLYLDQSQSFVSAAELESRRLDALQLREWCIACGITLEDFSRRLEEALALQHVQSKPKHQKKKAPPQRGGVR